MEGDQSAPWVECVSQTVRPPRQDLCCQAFPPSARSAPDFCEPALVACELTLKVLERCRFSRKGLTWETVEADRESLSGPRLSPEMNRFLHSMPLSNTMPTSHHRLRPLDHFVNQHTALIEAARQGDQFAIEQLLQICRPNLRRVALTQCNNAADADDAVQETILMVYRRIGALRTVTSFSSWVFAIVRRECYRLLRRMRGQVEMPEDNHPIFAYYARPDLRSDLATAIQSLPEKYRDAIVLRDFEEYSVSEIASKLRLSHEAVKSRIYRGRQMVREYLLE